MARLINRKILILACIIFTLFFNLGAVFAVDGVIEPSSRFAWGENIGWINFASPGGSIEVTDTAITGFVWSSNYGWINLGPFTNSSGVTNDGAGVLDGHGWSGSLGWISFSGVKIIVADGKFTGIAGVTGTPAGRINFDCANCGVFTTWRPTEPAEPPTETAPEPEPSEPPTEEETPPLFDIGVEPPVTEPGAKNSWPFAVLGLLTLGAGWYWLLARRKKGRKKNEQEV